MNSRMKRRTAMAPAVSVVMSTYNGAAFVAEALESIFCQTLKPCEVVIVDDCSLDHSRTIVEKLARTAPVPVRLLKRSQNSGGPARPLNQGIAAATGEFIAILDQDDVFSATKLEDQVACLEKNPTLSFVFSLCGRHERPGELVTVPRTVEELRARGTLAGKGWRLPASEMFRLLLRLGNFIIGYPAILFRRADWLRKGGLDECFTIASDYEFLCWLALEGDAAFINRAHYVRRFHSANLCNRQEDTRIEAYRVKARYLAQEPWALQDPELSAVLREELFDLAYLLRQRGHYREALRYYWLSLLCWGWEARTLRSMAKLLPHWALMS
jgi:glycosyltransferase involved in cell wall biosynthesis